MDTTGDAKPGTAFVKRLIEDWVVEAFRLISADVAERPTALWSQGIHLEGITGIDVPGYLVNGDRVYKLLWNMEGTQITTATELEGPADGDYVFDLEKRNLITVNAKGAWLPCINKAEDFFTKPKYTFIECYRRIYEIINTVCEFKHQENDTEFCTLLVFYSYILDAMQTRVMTHLLGEFESGKSSLLSLIGGGR